MVAVVFVQQPMRASTTGRSFETFAMTQTLEKRDEGRFEVLGQDILVEMCVKMQCWETESEAAGVVEGCSGYTKRGFVVDFNSSVLLWKLVG